MHKSSQKLCFLNSEGTLATSEPVIILHTPFRIDLLHNQFTSTSDASRLIIHLQSSNKMATALALAENTLKDIYVEHDKKVLIGLGTARLYNNCEGATKASLRLADIKVWEILLQHVLPHFSSISKKELEWEECSKPFTQIAGTVLWNLIVKI